MSEKTEQPTAKKLRDARQQGQVAHSKDFTQTVLILALFGYLIAHAKSLLASLADMMLLPASLTGMAFDAAADALISGLARAAIEFLLPFIGIVVVIGIFVEMLQVGVLLAFKAIQPSGKKLDVGQNLKNMFAAKSWVELLKSVFKIGVVGSVIWLLLAHEIGGLLTVPRAGVEGVGVAVGALMASLFKQVAVAYCVIAGFDGVYQRLQHRKQLMMGKDEVQREYKEMEGDPHIKHKRRHLHQEMLAEGAVQAARKASVVVTNPTHLAIALRYDEPETTPLPLVLAKGEGALAQRMKDAAIAAGVPVMQNIPLARALMASAEIEQFIPAELVAPVAELLRAVRALNDGHHHGHDPEEPR
ncbi:type III secretion system export apparatus subunit SctU [Aquabacterium sp.]|uniref:type III secretion system export apparatus subunit SctU n=1 Tax=Aquabacterium sp. TaxID=1872578 RepID=UPI002C39595C|nr:type III secretion system export apparatus subunit SctU [Aquabacterium sp.]HSW08470.1 type III secretion system export apparatus subunit SctU [Aquabacterium sp.]